MTARLAKRATRPNGIRSFISIEIPRPIREQMVRALEPLKSVRGKFNWSSTNNLHITLKFLGDCTRGRLELISKRLADIAARHRPFEMTFGGVGVFPSHAAPRIIWLGVKDGVEQLLKLSKDVTDSMEEIGFKKESRPFRPHITLARIKYLSSRDALKASIEALPQVHIDGMTADHIFLMRSQLRTKGAIYTVIERLCLSGGETHPEAQPPSAEQTPVG